jgi:hypothetical protein
MDADEFHVDAAGNHRLQRGIGGRLGEAVETPMLQVRDTRRELQAYQRAEGEDVVGIATTIGMVPACGNLALVIEQRVQYMQRLARRGRDQLGVEGAITVGARNHRGSCSQTEPFRAQID